ncbi:MAG TPA: radical SAM protein [Polyangiaceae bacterium]|nr:radical SAM protein [Polyangiaceae bacterium]
MRIALLYPPPWKIAAAGDEPFGPLEGAPEEFEDGDLDADFFQTPYGLFTLASEAIGRGHRVKVLNLSAFTWKQVERVVAELDADVFGMSCWTANRRGVVATAEAIRRAHPKAHVVVGGPHATPFARELLDRFPAIDTVTLGESEDTFLELLGRIEAGESTTGIAGSAYRADGKAVLAAPRPSIRKLDVLTPPQSYFATHILMTSRGCPWACTFCGAETTWGRGFRGHSVTYVVDAMERALERLPVRMIQVKDDTFTANKKRALEICREIRRRGLQFFWSCDTRVDVLDEELLVEMRLAGCQRLSLGVESGSDRILENIDKKISAAEIVAAARLAKSVGIQVRFYMMLGNRGETLETFRETVRFLDVAQPHQYVFSCLSIYPGTRDFDAAVEQGWLDPELFFREDFQELKTPFDADEETTRAMNAWFREHKGIQNHYVEDVPAARAILEKVGDYHAAHIDLGAALYRAGEYERAEHHLLRALELGYPVPGLAYNTLACIAWARGDLEAMQGHFMTAAKTDPQHQVLIRNVDRVRGWFRERGPERGLPLELTVSHNFQLLERTLQPTLPGPLPPDFADFDASPQPVPRHLPSEDEVTPEGHEKQAFPERRLRVLA